MDNKTIILLRDIFHKNSVKSYILQNIKIIKIPIVIEYARFSMNISNIFNMKVEFTIEQKVALESLQRQSRDHHVRDRIRCVLLSSEGWSTAMIAQSQRIHETTVLRHISDYLVRKNLLLKMVVPTVISVRFKRLNSLNICRITLCQTLWPSLR